MWRRGNSRIAPNQFIVPALRVGMPQGTLRVPCRRSGTSCVTTRSVGTIHAERGNDTRGAWERCKVPPTKTKREKSQRFLPLVLPISHPSFPRSAWECLRGRSASRAAGAAQAALPRGAWERYIPRHRHPPDHTKIKPLVSATGPAAPCRSRARSPAFLRSDTGGSHRRSPRPSA